MILRLTRGGYSELQLRTRLTPTYPQEQEAERDQRQHDVHTLVWLQAGEKLNYLETA